MQKIISLISKDIKNPIHSNASRSNGNVFRRMALAGSLLIFTATSATAANFSKMNLGASGTNNSDTLKSNPDSSFASSKKEPVQQENIQEKLSISVNDGGFLKIERYKLVDGTMLPDMSMQVLTDLKKLGATSPYKVTGWKTEGKKIFVYFDGAKKPLALREKGNDIDWVE